MTEAAPDGMSGLLRLVQWLSPAFPLGAYAMSHGIEAAVQSGAVRSPETLAEWIADVLDHGSGRADAILLCHVLRGGEPLEAADLARALAASRERLQETEAQGRALALTLTALDGVAREAHPLPVALGLAARGLAPPATIAALMLQAFAANLVSCGVRAIPIGQSAGQGVTAALLPLIERVAVEAAASTPDDIATSAFGADLAAMAHETLDVRIFLT